MAQILSSFTLAVYGWEQSDIIPRVVVAVPLAGLSGYAAYTYLFPRLGPAWSVLLLLPFLMLASLSLLIAPWTPAAITIAAAFGSLAVPVYPAYLAFISQYFRSSEQVRVAAFARHASHLSSLPTPVCSHANLKFYSGLPRAQAQTHGLVQTATTLCIAIALPTFSQIFDSRARGFDGIISWILTHRGTNHADLRPKFTRLHPATVSTAAIPFVIGNACTLPGLLIGLRIAWTLRDEVGARASQLEHVTEPSTDTPAAQVVQEHTIGVEGKGPVGKVRV